MDVTMYRSGSVVEEMLSPPPRTQGGQQRGERKKPSSPSKQKTNQKLSVREFSRVMNANINPGDFILTLTYRDDKAEEMEAKASQQPGDDGYMERLLEVAVQDFASFRKTLERTCTKAGVDLRFIRLTSDLDGDTGEILFPRHFLVVPAACGELVRQAWASRGEAVSEVITERRDLTPVAERLMGNIRKNTRIKTYSPSRNLIHPEPQVVQYPDGVQLAPPPGAVFLAEEADASREVIYIRYWLPPEMSVTPADAQPNPGWITLGTRSSGPPDKPAA